MTEAFLFFACFTPSNQTFQRGRFSSIPRLGSAVGVGGGRRHGRGCRLKSCALVALWLRSGCGLLALCLRSACACLLLLAPACSCLLCACTCLRLLLAFCLHLLARACASCLLFACTCLRSACFLLAPRLLFACTCLRLPAPFCLHVLAPACASCSRSACVCLRLLAPFCAFMRPGISYLRACACLSAVAVIRFAACRTCEQCASAR